MNTLKKQFSDALKREGKTITSYYANVNYKVLFRQTDKKDTSTDITGIIFYDASIPLYQGQLVTYNGEQYILMNKLPVDGNVYYKSSMLKCNVFFKGIPCYGYKLSLGLDRGTTISTLDGNGELITEHTTAVENIAINTLANLMNRWFEVINTYNISGISHLILAVSLAPTDNFTFTLTAPETNLAVDVTSQLTAVCANNGEPITGQTVTYSSSDTSIATVSSTGLVTTLKAGLVTITGMWIEKSKTETVTYNISAGTPTDYTMTITSSGQFTIDRSRTLTPTLKDGSGNVITGWTAVWSFNYNGMPQSDFTITYVGNNCTVKIAENYDLIDEVLVCTCTTSDNLATAFYSATIGV